MLTQIEMDTLRQQHFYKKMIELMEQKVALQRECIEGSICKAINESAWR